MSGTTKERSAVSNNKNVKERIWINLVTSEITLQPLEPDTDTPSCTMSVSLQFEKVTQMLDQLLAKVESATREEHSLRFMKVTLGGLIPADCAGLLDTSQMTGESLLVTMRKGDKAPT